MGAPYGQYLLDDVAVGKRRRSSMSSSTPGDSRGDQRRQLRECAATRGSVCIWCYAPGYFDGDQTSLEAMQELTWFTLAQASTTSRHGPHQPLALPSPRFAKGHSERRGRSLRCLPWNAPTEQILFTYPDGSNAVAFRRAGHLARAAPLFVGAPGLTSELLRFAARQAGGHLYTETDCNVYANGPFVAVHGSQDGAITS